MFPAIQHAFREKPVKAKIARAFVELGLSIRDGKVFSGNVEIPIKSLASALGVNRKTVYSFIQEVENDFVLSEIFSRLRPTGDFSEIAPILGYEVLVAKVPLGKLGKLVRSLESRHSLIYLHWADEKVKMIYEPELDEKELERVRKITKNVKIFTFDKKKRDLICKWCRVEYCPRRYLK